MRVNQAGAARARARPGHLVRRQTPEPLLAGSAGPGCASPCGSPPPARRAAARARGRPARTVLRPGRVVLVAQAARHLAGHLNLARARRVRRGVHAGMDRLDQRQPPPRAARPRRRPRPQHVPAADPGARRDGRLHPRRRRCTRSSVRRRHCGSLRGTGLALGAGRTRRPSRIPPIEPAVRHRDSSLRTSRWLAPPSCRPALAYRPGACSTPPTWPASEP